MFDLVPFGRGNKELSRYFDDFDKSFWRGFDDFRTDIIDKGDCYELKADMPGFEKDDIHLNIEGDYLTIHAEHSSEQENRNKRYVRQERSYRTVSRSFNISDVKTDQIKAQYKNGVLILNLPKRDHTAPNGRRIDIE